MVVRIPARNGSYAFFDALLHKEILWEFRRTQKIVTQICLSVKCDCATFCAATRLTGNPPVIRPQRIGQPSALPASVPRLSRFLDEFVSDADEEAAVAPRASPGIVAEEAIDPLFGEASALGSLDSFVVALGAFHENLPLGAEDIYIKNSDFDAVVNPILSYFRFADAGKARSMAFSLVIVQNCLRADTWLRWPAPS
jgi:hypothetical protein